MKKNHELYDFKDSQLIKELQRRIKNNARINTLIAGKKKERLEFDLREIEDRTGTFEFVVHSKEGSVTLHLPVDEFLNMVKYLGTVAVSYQEWLKRGAE